MGTDFGPDVGPIWVSLVMWDPDLAGIGYNSEVCQGVMVGYGLGRAMRLFLHGHNVNWAVVMAGGVTAILVDWGCWLSTLGQ